MYSNLTVSLCEAKGPQTTVGVVTINHLSINLALTAIALQYFIGAHSKGNSLLINIPMISLTWTLPV